MGDNEALFSEHYVAAQSLKNSWTRLASTYGCIWVALSRSTLTIRPNWYASWAIRLLALDLCHEIPIRRIRSVTETGNWFGYGKVELRFATVEGDDRRIVLYLKQYGEFVEKVRGAMGQ